MNGTALIRQKAKEALEATRRDRFAAGRLFREWAARPGDLFEAIAGAAVDQAISAAIRCDFSQERQRIRAEDTAQAFVPCLPQRSEKAEAETATRLAVRCVGLWGLVLPGSSKRLWDATAEETAEAFRSYRAQRRGAQAMELLFGFIVQACPDRARLVREQIDLDTLRVFKRRAESLAAKVVAEPLEARA